MEISKNKLKKAKVYESLRDGELLVVREEVFEDFMETNGTSERYKERNDLKALDVYVPYETSIWVTDQESGEAMYESFASFTPEEGINDEGGIYVGDGVWIFPDGSMGEW